MVLTQAGVPVSSTEELLEGEWLWSLDGESQVANIWLEHTASGGKYCSFTEHRPSGSFDANKHTSIHTQKTVN